MREKGSGRFTGEREKTRENVKGAGSCVPARREREKGAVRGRPQNGTELSSTLR